MKKGEISQFMIAEHGKILTLLSAFKKKANTKNAGDSFYKLKEKQKRHMTAEEKAILILHQEGKQFSEIVTILKQHEELRNLTNHIEDYVEKNLDHYDETLKKLLELMKEHINLENSKFYPKLDKELDDKQKKMIMETFRTFIIGNIGV